MSHHAQSTPRSHVAPDRSKHTVPVARLLSILLLVLVCIGPLAAPSAATGIGLTTRVSIANDATQADGASFGATVSGNGRFVVFGSAATSLIAHDGNSYADIFVYDRQMFTIDRMSVAADGTPPDAPSEGPAISGDGRFVAFYSAASNLVPNDTNGTSDVFVRDRLTTAISRVSVASNGAQANGPSAGSRNGGRVSISADGRYVAFASAASNLVDNDTNGVWDVFLHDRQTGATTRVSRASDGTQGNDHSGAPSLAGNGLIVGYESLASNLVADDLNGVQDIFAHNPATGATIRASLSYTGVEADGHSGQPSLSTTGQFIAFASDATNLIIIDTNAAADIFVRDLATSLTSRVSVASDGSQGNSHSLNPSISADGRIIAFTSAASNIVAQDTNQVTDVFYRDRQLNLTVRASIASDGTQGNGPSETASVSADGRFIAFDSYARNLVAGDTNTCGFYVEGHCPDVFVRERLESQGERIQGTVRLQGRTSFAGTSLLLSGPTTTSTLTDGEGAFTFTNILPGEYILTARRDGWLCSTLPVSINTGQTLTVQPVQLRAGDIDGNGVINIFDLVFVAAFYGQQAPSQPVADLNEDGNIGLADLVLLAFNFGEGCPQPWTAPTAAKAVEGKAPVAAPRITLQPGKPDATGRTTVEVWADGVSNAHGFELTVQTDGKRASLVGDAPFALDDGLADRVHIVFNKAEGRTAQVAAVVLGQTGLTGRVRLGTLTVQGDSKAVSVGGSWVDATGHRQR